MCIGMYVCENDTKKRPLSADCLCVKEREREREQRYLVHACTLMVTIVGESEKGYRSDDPMRFNTCFLQHGVIRSWTHAHTLLQCKTNKKSVIVGRWLHHHLGKVYNNSDIPV